MLNEAFQSLKGNLEPSQTFDAKISQHHNAVRGVVQNSHPGTDTKLIGSLARKTRIQPRDQDTFDIDILVILGTFNNWVSVGGITPQQATSTVHAILDETTRYGSMAPQIDEPTVSFTYPSDKVKVELVPCYRDNIGRRPDGTAHFPIGRGYWVAKNGTWELVDYDHEIDHISQANSANAGDLVPFVKLLKALRRVYFPQLTSFALELIAAETLPILKQNAIDQGVTLTWPQLITDFFTWTGGHLMRPIQAPGSNSTPIVLDQSIRTSTLQSFTTLGEYCQTISGLDTERAQLEGWKRLYGDFIPLS
jgi:hypothetical protein